LNGNILRFFRGFVFPLFFKGLLLLVIALLERPILPNFPILARLSNDELTKYSLNIIGQMLINQIFLLQKDVFMYKLRM